ncbi:MAG: peptidoglycan DD-metalloendopeptidase family protein, partial [Alphaproteobacteria bacterium]
RRAACVPDRARLVLAVAALLACAAGGAVAQDQPAPDQRLADVEERLDAAREEQSLYADDVSALNVRLAELGRELVARAAEVQRMEAAVMTVEARLAKLKATEAERTAALAARRDTLSALVSALLGLARRPPEALVAMPGTLADVRHTGLLLAALVPELGAEAASLDADLRSLASLRVSLAEERDAHGQAIARLTEGRERVTALLTETAELRAARLGDRRDAAQRAAALAAEAQDLKALIAALAEAEPAVVAEPELAEGVLGSAGTGAIPVPAGKPAPSTGAVAAGTSAPVVTETVVMEPSESGSGAIVSLAPSPKLPAVGDIVRRFGEPGEDGQISRGLVIATTLRAQVVAPRAGEVVYAGRFKNLGELLIIAHGDEYHSVLAGFARIDAVVGQRVSVGEPVGVMGDAEGETSLYVELRRAGEPVDPLPWLSTAQNEDGS